jgi:hypothetical protein
VAQSRAEVPEREKDTHALVWKLKAIREPRMRCAALAEFLSREPDEKTVRVLRVLLTGERPHADAAFREAVETVSATLSDPSLLRYEERARLYAAAKAAGHQEIARLFFDASPASEAEHLEDGMAEERAVVPRGRQLTLGERKSLARGHRRELLEHLLRDPHPDVVTILLGNPHVTERDVLVIAARRPSPPASLEAVAANARWRSRYSVKRALVMNPHTPPHVALRLVTGLRRADLCAVRDDPNLAGPLRKQAEELLGRR